MIEEVTMNTARIAVLSLTTLLMATCGPPPEPDVPGPEKDADPGPPGEVDTTTTAAEPPPEEQTATGEDAPQPVEAAGAEAPPAEPEQAFAPLPGFDDPARKLAWSVNGFALELLDELSAGGGNVTFSPLSVHQALMMTGAGAAGETADEMQSVLQIQPGSTPAARDLADGLGQGQNTAVMANRLWVQKGYPMNKPYLELVEKDFGAAVGLVDFLKGTEKARKSINKWVKKKTQKKIPELLEQGQVTDQTRVVLTNAVYLEARWEDEFKKNATHDRCFENADGSGSTVPMMYQMGMHHVFEATDGTLLLEKPYKGGDMSMWLMLPPAGSDPGEALDGMQEALTVQMLHHHMTQARQGQSVKVGLLLPRFETRFRKEIKKQLQAMGMKRAFDAQQADFSRMASTDEPLFIGLVVHEAFVRVDEKGTVAAAATAVSMAGGGKPQYIPFEADRPFVYFITDNRTDAILFLGSVNKLDGAACTP